MWGLLNSRGPSVGWFCVRTASVMKAGATMALAAVVARSRVQKTLNIVEFGDNG